MNHSTDDGTTVYVKSSLLKSQLIGFLLLITYCLVYGVTAQIILASWQLLYFSTSILFALGIVYMKDQESQKTRIKKCIIANQVMGTILIASYILIYGISSFAILTGFQLVFFMSSYVFAMSLIYINSTRVNHEIISYSSTSPFITANGYSSLSNEEIHIIISEINNSLSTIIGFSELMLRRNYNEYEKVHMIKTIFEQAISISHSTSKISENISDSPTNPYLLEDLESTKKH